MSERCIYCDPDFGKDLKDDTEDQELVGDCIDAGAFGEIVHTMYMTAEGIEMFLFDNNSNVISKVKAIVNYCPMCGRKLRSEGEE